MEEQSYSKVEVYAGERRIAMIDTPENRQLALYRELLREQITQVTAELQVRDLIGDMALDQIISRGRLTADEFSHIKRTRPGWKGYKKPKALRGHP